MLFKFIWVSEKQRCSHVSLTMNLKMLIGQIVHYYIRQEKKKQICCNGRIKGWEEETFLRCLFIFLHERPLNIERKIKDG